MSKIICDVCGTSYPETATQCPICGCVRSVDAKIVAGNTNETEAQTASSYTYVKGGRFSKSNVKRRNKGKAAAPVETFVEEEQPANENGGKDAGIVITTIFLLLAITAVVIYIAVRFFGPVLFGNDFVQTKPTTAVVETQDTTVGTQDTVDGQTQPTVDEQTQATVPETTEATLATVPCTEITLSKTEITFESEGAALLLNVTASPEDTTDIVQFLSADDSVATVSEDGKITAVGKGETVIIVTCGTAVAECKVICNIEEAEEETTEPETSTDAALTFNREDFTLNSKGQTWKLYTGDIAANQITWTSDDEKVATIKDGVVTAVGSGMTTVYGEYGGTKLSCVVRCSEAMGKADTTVAETEATTATNKGNYTISHEDVSVYVGDTFDLVLKDEIGDPVEVSWTASDSSICSVSGNTVTANATGMITVSTSVDGAVYSCIVRVYVK